MYYVATDVTKWRFTFFLNYAMSLKTGIVHYATVNVSKLSVFKPSLYYISVHLQHPDSHWNFDIASYLVGTRDVPLGVK